MRVECTVATGAAPCAVRSTRDAQLRFRIQGRDPQPLHRDVDPRWPGTSRPGGGPALLMHARDSLFAPCLSWNGYCHSSR